MKKEITIFKMLKNFLKKEETSIEDNRTVWVILSDQIEELYEKVREIYYLGQTDLADSFKAKVDGLRERYKEELNYENNDITSHDFDDVITGITNLSGEINDYLNGEGKVLENRRIGERYYKKIEEILTNSDEKSTEELWAETRRIAEELKFDCERNSRLDAQQFNRIIAKLVLRILNIQAKRGEEIDLTQAEELCSKEDLLCAIKDKLIEMSKKEQSEVKEKYLDRARYLDEKSLQDFEVWQILSGVKDIKILGVKDKKPKKEIKIRKPRSILLGFRYEGLGLEKIPGISVYTLGDVDEETGEWINLEKKYGKFPRDFGDENGRVLQIEINGVEEVEHYDCIKYKRLQKVIFGDSVKKIDECAFAYKADLKEVVFGKNVKSIGYRCFEFSGLEEVFIPENVETIEASAFVFCDKLKSVQISSGEKRCDSTCFLNTPAWDNGNVQISDGTEIIAPNGISIFTLGKNDPKTGERKNVRRVLGKSYEFPNYSNQVLEIEINDVDEINERKRLKDYPNLEKVVLGENITEIGNGAFADCKSLEKIIIARGIKIPSKCFARDSSLTKIGIVSMTVPDISYIANDAFLECPNNIVIHGRY